MLVRGKTPNARDERVHRGRERPQNPVGRFGPEKRGKKGVAPGHETVFAAYSFWWCPIVCSLVYKYLAFPSAERDAERDAERSSEIPVPRFMPDSLLKMS